MLRSRSRKFDGLLRTGQNIVRNLSDRRSIGGRPLSRGGMRSVSPRSRGANSSKYIIIALSMLGGIGTLAFGGTRIADIRSLESADGDVTRTGSTVWITWTDKSSKQHRAPHPRPESVTTDAGSKAIVWYHPNKADEIVAVGAERPDVTQYAYICGIGGILLLLAVLLFLFSRR